jgi:Domain of unknown function (DUF4189)
MRTTAHAGIASIVLSAIVASTAWATEEALCSGTIVPLTVNAGHSPFVRTRLSGQDGYFQIDTGATISTVDATLFHRPVNSVVLLDDFAFPGLPRGRFTALRFGPIPGPPDGRQIGQIGIDLLSHRAVEFHFETTSPYLAIADRPCPADRLRSAGFIAISQRGYFGTDRSRLGGIIDNTPVVFIRLGSVTVPAWVDTGFIESNSAGMVQINDLLLQKLRGAGVPLKPRGSGQAINCHGEHLKTELWQAEGTPMQVTTDQAQPLLTYGAPPLAVLPRNSCSGPGNIGVPVARIGAAYVNWWRTFILDSISEQVWVSPARARMPAQPVGRRALVIAQNKDGTVTITTADSLELATETALKTCGKNGGSCSVKVGIAPSEQRCAAVAISKEHAKLTIAERVSMDDAKRIAIDECSRSTDGACTVQFSGCN